MAEEVRITNIGTVTSASVTAPRLTRDDALAQLRALAENPELSEEHNHRDADAILLELIGDPDITAAFNAIEKWYA